MPDVRVPLLLPSDGVYYMEEVVAGSPINFLDQTRNIFIVDGRCESTHTPRTPCCQLPLAVMRLSPPLIVILALLGGCNTTGSLPSNGSSEPGADEAADPASTLLLVADPALPLLEALGSPLNSSLLCRTTLSVVWAGVGQVYGQVPGRLSVFTSTKTF